MYLLLTLMVNSETVFKLRLKHPLLNFSTNEPNYILVDNEHSGFLLIFFLIYHSRVFSCKTSASFLIFFTFNEKSHNETCYNKTRIVSETLNYFFIL